MAKAILILDKMPGSCRGGGCPFYKSRYFAKIKKLIQKATSDYKIQIAADSKTEREQLLARLKELEMIKHKQVSL